jgi:hypothetical protein
LFPDCSETLAPEAAIAGNDRAFHKSQGAAEDTVEGIATAVLTLPTPHELKEPFIRILHRPDRSLVAVMKLLSPTNKGTHFGNYLEKRFEITETPVHLVELDLLISGRKPPMMQPLPPGQFHLFISRGDERPKCTVSGWSIRHTLPAIRIPLVRPGEFITSKLQEVYDAAYTRARYERALDYSKPLDLPLSDAHRDWLADRVPPMS